MSADPLLGEIMTVGFNFAPRGWATCSGQLLAISQNSALFALLGTAFGGDGRTTFGLPDLRGRTMRGTGQGQGLNDVRQGQKGGSTTETLTTANLPAHSHTATLFGETASGTLRNPAGNMLASHQGYAAPVPADNKAMAQESIQVGHTGGSLPFNIQGPFLGLFICIAMQGVFPSRS